MTNRPAQEKRKTEGELQERRTVGKGVGKVLISITGRRKEGREGGWVEGKEQRGMDDK